MASIEYLISKMPFRLFRTYEDFCPYCRHSEERTTILELCIDMLLYEVRPNVLKPRYKMYYKPLGGNIKCIGNPTGIGFLTLKEALRDLLTYKKDIRGEV